MAENISSYYGIFICNVDFNLNIFSWSCIFYILTLSIKETHYLSWNTSWHHCKLISKIDSSIFNLSVNNQILIFHLIKNWNSKWSLRISLFQWKIFEDFHEGWSFVPIACCSNWFFKVCTSESCNWNPEQIFICVTSFVQEWLEAIFDFIISCLRPFAVVHLIDNDDELLNTQTLCQLCVLSSLTFFFETSFKLTFSG